MKATLPLLCLVVAACGGKPAAPPPSGPTQRHYAFRAIGGVSMGGMGSSFIGTTHPELFDGIGSLGGPMDFTYLLHFIETSDTGGFCTLAQLQALLQQDPTGAVLNQPAALGCMQQAAPQVLPYEHTATFNHWRYTDNGGNFDRNAYLDLFEDLSEAFGNPGTYNPESSFFAPGLTQQLWQEGASLCQTPLVIPGKAHGGTQPVYNAEYNPNGDYDAISFCDGQRPIWYCANAPAQEIDWCQMQASDTASSFPQTFCKDQGGALQASNSSNQPLFLQQVGTVHPCWPATRPMYVAMAIDINGNGKRDYGEPLVINAHERFQDVGTDGCPDPLEDGRGGCVSDPAKSPYDAVSNPDPNGDDYDFRQNALGTENDWAWEKGEPFQDDGLDGVPGTGDYGEGNGTFDQSPAMANYFGVDPRTNIVKRWPSIGADATHVSQLFRIDYLIDGGVRDVFNFGVSGAQIFGLLHALLPAGQTQLFADFTSWPSANAPFATDTDYQADGVNWSLVPRDLMTFYGTLEPTAEELAAGDGDHVGTVGQALDRFDALYHWFSHRWDGFPDVELGSKPEQFSARQNYTTFYSQALGANRDFGIVVPPGYDSPENASARYPVIYILHGYGMSADDMMGVDVVYDGDMATGDLRKMIAVFPSGRCCFTNTQTGEHQCSENDANGTPYGPPWQRECHSGNFFVNSQGGPLGPPRAYLDSFTDLVKYVDQNYRTLAANGGQDVKISN
ncbi:MAG: alpha/beta hydrolase [Myxococcales bacterium]